MASSPPPELDGRELILPKPHHISAVLYDPVSKSMALRHSNSSFFLYPSFSPISSSSLPSSHTLVPSPTSSAAFLHMKTAAGATTTVFVTTSPLLQPLSVVLRFYALRGDRFVKTRVVLSHRDLEFDRVKGGVLFKVNHGVSVRLSGGVNVFGLYSVSNSKIWVFAVRSVVDGGGGEALKLMKCAVIDCCFRVFEIKILFGFLVLGEENGVRFFPLRPLVKGKYGKEKNGGSKRLLNSKNVLLSNADGNLNTRPVNGEKGGDKQSDSAKLRSVKLRQDSKEIGAFFVAFKDEGSSESLKMPGRSVKAISIQALSENKFMILDSVGDLHLLSLSYSVHGLCSPCPMQQLTHTMKVVKLAVNHDVSAVTRPIWISDGSHTVHLMMVSELDTSSNDTEKKDSGEKLMQTSVAVTKAIFTSEKIQDIVTLDAEAVLVLGQGSLFAYAIPNVA